jgi:hypothetical protein
MQVFAVADSPLGPAVLRVFLQIIFCLSSEPAVTVRPHTLQVFAVADSTLGPAVPRVFPQIKLINWFDIKKSEGEAQVRRRELMHAAIWPALKKAAAYSLCDVQCCTAAVLRQCRIFVQSCSLEVRLSLNQPAQQSLTVFDQHHIDLQNLQTGCLS